MNSDKTCLILCILLLISGSVGSQVVQEYPVMDFSGGLVNSISNTLMKDNQALVLENYTITDLGYIERRPGMPLHYTDTQMGNPINNLMAYNGPYGERHLLMTRLVNSYYPHDSANKAIDVITVCVDSLTACSTILLGGYYSKIREADLAYNLKTIISNDRLLIAGTKSDMLLYDGQKIWPTKPYGPGQPRVYPIDAGGNVTGTFRYKYCYEDAFESTKDTSNFSAPSDWIDVTNGSVYIEFDTCINNNSWITLIYRQEKYSDNYEFVGKTLLDSIGAAAWNYFLDTVSSTNDADTLEYKWGHHPMCASCDETGCEDGYYADCASALEPPGGLEIVIDTHATTTWILQDDTITYYDSCAALAYAVVFVDSAGIKTLAAPATCKHIRVMLRAGGYEESWFAQLHDIPVPDNPYIKFKLLLRMVQGGVTETAPSAGKWVILDTLAPEDSTAGDAMSVVNTNNIWCDQVAGELPESTCYVYAESTLAFDPIDIEVHRARYFAIGDTYNRNVLYYSNFGEPERWPYDKIMSIPSTRGDWLVRLLSHQRELLLFRQNSILSLTGLSFYQYSIDEIVSDIGISAPASLASGNKGIFFFHKSGVYAFSSASGISIPPLSFPIQNSIDSISNVLLPWGEFVNQEYWFSAPINSTKNNMTYIYSLSPNPHWKAYDFGIKDAVSFDWDTTYESYSVGKWAILRDNDTVYRWDYLSADSLDGTVEFTATYQSKYFFDDLNREKVHYLDLIGGGRGDSLKFTFYDNYGDSLTGAGEAVDSAVIAVDFKSRDRIRVKVNHIFTSFSVKIQDFGAGDYLIRGYVIGYTPWDKGRAR